MENQDQQNNDRVFHFIAEILEQIPEGNEDEVAEEEVEYQHEEVEEEVNEEEENEQQEDEQVEDEEEEQGEDEQQEIPNALAQQFDELLFPPPPPEEEEDEAINVADMYDLAELFNELILEEEDDETGEEEEESGEEEEEEYEEEDTYEFDLPQRPEQEEEEYVEEEEDDDTYGLSQLFNESIDEEEEVNEEEQEEEKDRPQENDEEDRQALVEQFNELFLLPPPAPLLSAEEVDAFYANHPLPNLPNWILADATAEIARQNAHGNEQPINAMDVIRHASEEAARYYRSYAESERARELGFYNEYERNIRRAVIPNVPHCSHQHPQLIIQQVPRPQRPTVYTAAAFGGGDAPISEREFFANLPLPPLPEGVRPAPRDIGDHIFPDEDESDESPRHDDNEVEEEEAPQDVVFDSPEDASSPRFEVAGAAPEDDQKSPKAEKKTEESG